MTSRYSGTFILIFSVLILNSFVYTALAYQFETEGDKSSFISIKECPLLAQNLVQELGINVNKIHTCKINEENLFQSREKINVINLTYGDPEDCLAGCIYKNYTAVVNLSVNLVDSGQKFQFQEIIPKGSGVLMVISHLPEYASKSNKKDFSCDRDIQNIVSESIGIKEGQWGRFLEFTSPFVCHWVETVSTEYPVDYTHSVNRGFKAQGEWDGYIFIKYASKNDETVSMPNVQYSERRLQEINWEENHSSGE